MSKLVLIILCFVLAIVGFNVLVANQYKRFLRTAERTTGQVFAKEEKRVDAKTQRKENWLHYSYEVGGKRYENKDRIEHQDLWMDIKQADTINVLYNPANPSESYPEMMITRRMGVAQAITGIH